MERLTRGQKLRYETVIRALALFVVCLLPSISLIPLGGLWLWQNGYLLIWSATALSITLSIVAFIKWKFRAPPSLPAEQLPLTEEDAQFSGREAEAWAKVQELAHSAAVDRLANREDAIELARETIATVAKSLRPDHPDALWTFTAPELLAMFARASRRLETVLREHVPFGDQLTIAQLLRLYRWRGAIDVADRAYDVWRIARLGNPVNAVTQEVRERLWKQMLQQGKTHVARIILVAYVEEVGRAAIELYAGGLREHQDADDEEVAAPLPRSRLGRLWRQSAKAGRAAKFAGSRLRTSVFGSKSRPKPK